MITRLVSILLLLSVFQSAALADVQNPYAPSRVAYDYTDKSPETFAHYLDRASLLQRLYNNDIFESSIVFVVHEAAIPLFAKRNRQHEKLMLRARSLAQGEIIQFRLCEASARIQGYKRGDFPDFIHIVPMADAELIALQHQGYAYLR